MSEDEQLPAWRMWAAAMPEDEIRLHMAAVLEWLERAWVLDTAAAAYSYSVERALREYGELRRAVIERWNG